MKEHEFTGDNGDDTDPDLTSILDLFGPVIHSYTRAEAIADGVLVDVSNVARTCGFGFPMALSAASYGRCVALSPAAERAGNDIVGRICDVMTMLRHAVRHGDSLERLSFSVLCVTDEIEPTLVDLTAICGPGDDGKPVVTIFLAEEPAD